MRSKIVKFVDVKDKTFNYLTVISEESPAVDKTQICRRWKFKCVCGNEKIIRVSSVLSGQVKSCGCKKTELTRNAIQTYYEEKYKNPVEQRLFGDYKSHGKGFTLTLDEFIKLVNDNCYYCGGEPSLIRKNRRTSAVKALNGIDRIDSKGIYSTDNCVTCCSVCNYMKNTLGTSEFLCHIKKIYMFSIENK